MASVPPARRGRMSFGTAGEYTVSALRQGLLLHCSDKRAGPSVLAEQSRSLGLKKPSFFRTETSGSKSPEGQHRSTGDTPFGARRDSNPRIESFTGSRRNHSSGIHVGISLCTAVKDGRKHSLEVILQAYFTNIFAVFHGKKAAKSLKNAFFSVFFGFFDKKGQRSLVSVLCVCVFGRWRASIAARVFSARSAYRTQRGEARQTPAPRPSGRRIARGSPARAHRRARI